jgi:predicted transcriptional regulator
MRESLTDTEEFHVAEIVGDIKELGYTDQWIADQMKVSQGCVVRLKAGVTQRPRIDTYFKLITLHKKCFPTTH